MPQYEKATRLLLAELSIGLRDLEQTVCCGAPIVESFSDRWVLLAAYNLALAGALGLDVLTVCGSCTNSLKRAQHLLDNPRRRAAVNEHLAPLGLRLEACTRVQHLTQVLWSQREALAARIVTPLATLRVALTYPCQVSRPSEIAGFDDPFEPRAMHELVTLTGAQIVDTGVEFDCCGSSYLMGDESVALAAGRRKLEASRAADVLVDACGNCHLLLERLQRAICRDESQERLPVLFLPQLLGLALGLPAEELGIRRPIP